MKKKPTKKEQLEKELQAKKWTENIELARQIVSARNNNQMRIAELAIECCHISWGGRVSEDTYTLTKFAGEIGISAKTLSNWVCIKKNVYDKLDIDLKTKGSYTTFSIASSNVNQQTKPEAVREIMRDILEKDSFELKIIKYLQDLRALHFNFETQDAAFRCSNRTLEQVIYYCEAICTFIKKDKKKIKGKNRNGFFTNKLPYQNRSAAESLGVPRKGKYIHKYGTITTV